MSERDDTLEEAPLAVAALAACFAKALGDQSETFRESFALALEEVSKELKSVGGATAPALLVLLETKDIIQYLDSFS